MWCDAAARPRSVFRKGWPKKEQGAVSNPHSPYWTQLCDALVRSDLRAFVVFARHSDCRWSDPTGGDLERFLDIALECLG